ncbi:isocitrate dehydrogenase [NAD] subunit gamma, mitochondrial-like [Trichogramma pretiosum]|uniref:isocitrate dehydrogenase [NAD] subunit gamma, mitochondrial-like n=1 Tax=Trichogramma pretiosum TaxID=7493 RepID=UPI0006C95F89|nr:isocitrate dehydrogenase [NAD] subunit gamma, mitochondrial-like [Trichogramma pretiosum]XP_023314345.1 isocitrate dehydrogenase [NAD] subunit gamma, mitochondrial-like [Trichogramma pretiosum]
MYTMTMRKAMLSCNCLRLQQFPYATAVPTADFQPRRRSIAQHKAHPRVYYGGRHTVTLLPGAGTGPELMDYVKKIFKYTGVPVDFEEIEIAENSTTDDLDYAITSIQRNGIALKGNIESNCLTSENLVGNVTLRKELDLYVNMVQCVSFPGTSARFNNVDITIIRQNVEGEYSMLEHQTTDGVVESLKIVTEENAKRIARYAFEHAINNGRKKVTIVHKANIMKLSDGLFLETARSVGEDYPEIACNDMIVDNACMQLVSNPHQFDMILTSNLYGSVISNVVCGLLGGVGIYSGRNVGENHVIFEPATRNSGHSIAGKNIANPVAMLHAASDMLQHLGLDKYAELIKAGIRGSLRDRVCTPDLGGTATSQEVVASIMKHIEIALQSHQ